MNDLTPVLPTPNDDIREYVGLVTAKGMITIPQEARRRHKIEPKTKVIIRVSSDTIEVKPMPMTLEDIMGSVPPLDSPKTIKEIREIIHNERAERYLQEIQR
jgi:bifunctional DNA-binding transcriptional regulator/antitoxin component of YhaV-PrlF toxin-antitoxin module